jgi:hypothetical protein
MLVVQLGEISGILPINENIFISGDEQGWV